MGATIKKRKMYEGFLEKVPILGTVPPLVVSAACFAFGFPFPVRSPLALFHSHSLSLSLCPFQRRSTTGRGSLSPTRWSRRSTTTAR